MNNVHIPQRLDGESFDAYRSRRAESHAINKANRTAGNGGESSRKSLRDSMRRNGTMGKKQRAYVALCAAWAAKRITKAKNRDKNGAYTLVGRTRIVPDTVIHGVVISTKAVPAPARRMWLGGISAQRGY